MSNYKIGTNGIKLVKKFEGLYLKAYKCPAGVWTIGYGHTGNVDGKPIKSGMKITKEKALELLRKDMNEFEKVVNENVKNKYLNQHRFDALVCFTFNVGKGGLTDSTLGKLLNSGDIKGASNQFLEWDKATVNGVKKSLKGLTRRRRAERKLFLDPVYKYVTEDNTYLRKGITNNSKLILKLKKNTKLTLLEKTNSSVWKVKTSGGSVGYVKKIRVSSKKVK